MCAGGVSGQGLQETLLGARGGSRGGMDPVDVHWLRAGAVDRRPRVEAGAAAEGASVPG